jgi:hypothetical protein
MPTPSSEPSSAATSSAAVDVAAITSTAIAASIATAALWSDHPIPSRVMVGPRFNGPKLLKQPLMDHQRSQAPLPQEAVQRCREALSDAWSVQPGEPVIMTYSTGRWDKPQNRPVMNSHWLLGLSAAAHGVPLVVAGLGLPSWPWWMGASPMKLPGSRRALQVIAALTGGESPVAFADSSDVLIVNRLDRAGRAALREARDTVWLGAECNSWPVCYRDAYLHDAEHQRCLRDYGACYPNGGIALGLPSGSWWRVPSASSEDSAASARLVAPKAQAAPSEPLGCLLWPQEPALALKLHHLRSQPPGTRSMPTWTPICVRRARWAAAACGRRGSGTRATTTRRRSTTST